MSRYTRSSIGNPSGLKPANNPGGQSATSRKRAGQNQSEDEPSTHTPKRNKNDSNDLRDHSGPLSLSNDTQEYMTPSRDLITTTSSSYFNKSLASQEKTDDSSNKKQSRVSSNQKFPPFRLLLDSTNGHLPTELSIIKEINKFTHLNCTYGRFTKSKDDRTHFLLYASTVNQFEFLLKKENWPKNINDKPYALELPNKTPASYSLIVRNIPPQWDAESFGEELKIQYPTIIRTVRLFRNGGIPLAKVRIDFSSHDVISKLLQAKRIVVDDSNLAFPIEPYVLPTKVLRCYNCQAFDDHVSAHCPFKDDPICFRCAQHHPYNPKCNNQIKCVHCSGDHMAGNPSCPVKQAKRKELNHLRESSKTANKSNQELSSIPSCKAVDKTITSAWQTNQVVSSVHADFSATNCTGIQPVSTNYVSSDNELFVNIIARLDNINCTMLDIKTQQDLLENKIERWNERITHNQNEIQRIYRCLRDTFMPMVLEFIKIVASDSKQSSKQNLTRIKGKLEECFSSLSSLSPENNHSKIINQRTASNSGDIATSPEYES